MTRISFDNFNFTNRKVILRTDFNVPFHPGTTEISDNTRIVATLPTIRKILQSSPASLIIISHLGRPKGKRIEKLSLLPVAKELSLLLGGESVNLIPSLEDVILPFESGKIYMLENIRFYPEEELEKTISNEEILNFSTKLAQLGDCFVNDAFGCMHRPHSSIVMKNFKGEKIAGFLVIKELENLEMLNNLDLLIVGGSKVSDKIPLLRNLIPRVKTIAIGGAMVFSFIKILSPSLSLGLSSPSNVEFNEKEIVEIIEFALKKGVKLLIPNDFIISATMDGKGEICDCSGGASGGIPPTMMGLDIGPKSRQIIKEEIRKAKQVFWNGPMGVFEREEFQAGTKELLEEIAALPNLKSVIGGGDTAAACYKFIKDTSLFTHISTGGGASLEFLEGKILPGVEALTDV